MFEPGHIFKVGQRVYLRASPHNTGTVSRTQFLRFRIVYDDPQRKPYRPRPVFWYPWPAAERFAVGRPAPQE